jgi:hypothetical protein
MALTMKERYARLDQGKLPQEYKDQFDVISANTDGFADEDLTPLFEENFKTLYELVEQRFPEAIKKAGKIVKEKPAKVKVVKKKKEKPAAAAHPARRKLSDKDIYDIEGELFLANKMGTSDEKLRADLIKGFAISESQAERWVKNRKKYEGEEFSEYGHYKHRTEKKKEKRKASDPNNVETLDGYKFNRKDPALKGMKFYDVKGKEWTCKGYNAKLDDCIMVDDKGKEVASCLKDMYLYNPKEKISKGNLIDECKETLKEAGYTVKSHKTGTKVIKRKKPRPEKEIIKERVGDAFTPITKDLEASDEKKAENKEVLNILRSIESKLTKLLNRLSNLADDGKSDKLKKLDELLSELLGE